MSQAVTARQNLVFYLLLAVAVVAGVYLRLDQFTSQVLLDDEWHAVHQLLQKGPRDLFLTIGQSDFSIPLGLLYWFEKEWFGLSELGMRWPLLLTGVATLLVLPLYARRFVGDGTALLFGSLLAISPMLVFYSRMARPYSLTLLLTLVALVAFQRFAESGFSRLKPAMVYILTTIVCAWLHLVSLPLLVAPFLFFGVPAMLKRDWDTVLRLNALGTATMAGLLLLVLPPLMAHPEALTVKLGGGALTFWTHVGALHAWLGTPSHTVVGVALLLGAAGLVSLWQKMPLVRVLLASLVLAYITVLLTRPAWIQHPQTMARYLFPALVLFLLAAAVGIRQLAAWGSRILARGEGILFLLLVTGALFGLLWFSPWPKLLAEPNSHTQHSVFRFDYREDHNLIRLYQQDFPLSPIWAEFAKHEPGSLKIAVAPFSFETHHWDAVRWEQISHQRVLPGYLVGLCMDRRWGEVPNGEGYAFENVAYLADPKDLSRRGFDYIVYQKPKTVVTNEGPREFGQETAHCEASLRERYPVVVYEDDLLVAFRVPR